jgi:DNA-binding NarL/FixJ family response regulator
MLRRHDQSRPDRRGSNGKITVLVASAVSERRKRWESRLHEAFALCEVAERRAVDQIMRHVEPDVLLLDLCLPGLGGVREISRVQRLSPRTKILVLASKSNDREAISALEAGASGYYSRDIEPGHVRKAVEGVHAGEIWIQRRVVALMLDMLRQPTRRYSSKAGGPDTEGISGGGAHHRRCATRCAVEPRGHKGERFRCCFHRSGTSGHRQRYPRG